MVFLSTGSRLDNPYSSKKGGGSLSPKLWFAVLLLVLWFGIILVVVDEDPQLRKEVLDDLHREENLIQSKLRRGRLRAKKWLRDRIGDDEPAASSSSSKSSSASSINANAERKHQWDLTRLEDLALRTGPADEPIHIVFSTDCGPYQKWQSYQFFLSALRVNQPGRITQIASGCTETEKEELNEWHEVHVAPLSLRFGLHLTPEFSNVRDAEGKTVGTYEFFNKPFGLRHWMEYGEGMGIDRERNLPLRHDTIVALLDPDHMLVRPITGHFASPADVFRTGSMKEGSGGNVDSTTTLKENRTKFTVRHGHPLSQEYGFRDGWRKYAHVAGEDSPATRVTATEALRSYAVGPPYVATALDMYRIATLWCEFAPLVHNEFPELMAEMYAFSIATAHLGLPHQLVSSMMVSDTSVSSRNDVGGGEGWRMIDAIPAADVCSFAMNSLDADVRPLPTLLHFCQRYGVGDHDFFAKKKLPTDFFTCESPLLEEPARGIGSGKYLYRRPPFLANKVKLSAEEEKREAFMICAMIGVLNEYALYFKNRHCGEGANLKKEISLHDLPE